MKSLCPLAAGKRLNGISVRLWLLIALKSETATAALFEKGMLQSRLPTVLSAHTSISRLGARAALANRDMASATAHDQTATLSLGCFWHPVSCCLEALQCMNGIDNFADLLCRMLSSASCQVSKQLKWGTQEAHQVSCEVPQFLAGTIRAGFTGHVLTCLQSSQHIRVCVAEMGTPSPCS